jgi:intein/homing endonuclease
VLKFVSKHNLISNFIICLAKIRNKIEWILLKRATWKVSFRIGKFGSILMKWKDLILIEKKSLSSKRKKILSSMIVFGYIMLERRAFYN